MNPRSEPPDQRRSGPAGGAAARDVDEYIARAPAETRPMLQTLRAIIRSEAPDAEERLSYGMPSYHRGGRLAYFSLHTHHIGLYPADRDDAEAAGLGAYLASKATLRFPLDQPLPVAAIRRFIRQRSSRSPAPGARRQSGRT